MPDRFDEVVVYSIEMRMRFRGLDDREGVLLRTGDRWTEWSPFREYGDAEAATWLRAALETDDPTPVRSQVPVNMIVPVVSPRRAADLVTAAGCTTVKVKVADPQSCLEDDLARLAAVRSVLGPEGRIRVDANGGFSVESAERALHAMAPIGLEYIEQPCATVEELAELRQRVVDEGLDVKIAADESIRKASDPHRVAELGAADIVVLKRQPLGGWRRCLELADELHLPVVMSSAVETSLGLWEGLQVAAALPELDYACGLNTAKLLDDDVLAEPLTAVDGMLEVGPRPTPDAKALKRVRAPRDRITWWMERLERCLPLAEAGLEK